jgi:hypothetical protein
MIFSRRASILAWERCGEETPAHLSAVIILITAIARKQNYKLREKSMSERKTKLNCWEFKRCGRQPQGIHVHDLGVCPATLEQKLDGAHGGVNAGRTCWVVAGTLCQGQLQGTFAQKFKNCKQCDFYFKVQEEERMNFHLSAVLLDKLK